MNRAGRMRITQKDVPFAASIDEIPSRAISEEVSKPRPNRTPSGYIFHGLSNRNVCQTCKTSIA